MNREKEQEYQENLAYLKEKFPQREVELPLRLQGDLLKQRALAGENPRKAYPKKRWAQGLAMACTFALIVGIGLYDSLSSPPEVDMKRSNAAPAAMEMAPIMEPAAFSLAAETEMESALGGRYDVATIWKSWETSRAAYNITPENIHSFDEKAESFTVITCYPDEGGMAQIVVLGGETDVAFDNETVIVTEISTGNQLTFKALTLELIG